jgi:hypothetical protein
MYNKTIGAKYEQTKGLGRVAIAALIRDDIKAAVRCGALPKAGYSVRCSGSSIGIRVSKVASASLQIHNPANLVWAHENPHTYPGHAPEAARERYTAEAQAILTTCDQIAAAYNYDRSEIESDYFDVRFYGHASFDHRYAAEIKTAEQARALADAAAPPPSSTRLLAVGHVDVPVANDVASDPNALTQEQADWLRGLGVEVA